MFAQRLSRITLPLLLLLLVSACGPHGESWNTGLHDLANVPLSAALQPALTASVATLNQPNPDRESVRKYAAYRRLRMELRPLATRPAAAQEVYTRWQADPQTSLWMQIAFGLDRLLDRPGELAQMLAEPVMSDTTTALGAYVTGWTAPTARQRKHWYTKAESLQDQLTPLTHTQLVIKLSGLDRAAGQSMVAVKRLIDNLPEARQAGGHQLEAIYWFGIARVLARDDRLDDALYAATLAAAHARSAEDRYLLLLCRVRIATIMSQRGEYETALQQLETYADRSDSLGYGWVLESSLDRAAQISSDIGDYKHAMKLDRRLLKHVREINDTLNIPRSLASIAHDFRMTGQLDSTFVYLKRAQAVVDSAGLELNRRKMTELMAGYYCQVGEYALAESLMVEAVGLGKAMGSRWTQATLLLELVPSALEMGRTDLAYEWLGRVAANREVLFARGQHFNFLADFEILSARLLADQGETRLASEALQRARSAVVAGGGEGKQWSLDAQSGELALQRGDIHQAEQDFMACLNQALQGDDPRQIDRSRFQLGQLYLQQNQFANAEAMFAPLGTDKTFGSSYRTGLTSLLLRGLTKARQGLYDEAIVFYDDGLSRLTTHSPADLALRFHVAHAEALTGGQYYGEADRELAAVLTALADQPHLVRFADLPVFRTDIERDTRVAKARNLQLGTLVPAAEMGRATLEILRPGLAERLASSKPSGPSLVYSLGEDNSWVWLVTNGEITSRLLPGRQEMQAQLSPILVDLDQPDRPLDSARLKALAELLLGNLAAHWPATTTLTLVPDGLLYQTPWAALPLGPTTVLDRGPLREIDPSVPDAAAAPSRRPQQLSLLAIGCDLPDNPGSTSLPRLREAEAEASAVVSLWPGPRAELAIGYDANWSSLLAHGLTGYGTIHIASHATVYQGVGGRSTLRLTARNREGSAETTPITMAAVRQLDLHAELVFLSSCRSGLPTTGDGTSSDFTSAFLAAGAHTVIASTAWVDDAAARQLAESFYDHWRGGATKAAALQAARQDVRDKWPHPAYWAFLRLTGDGN